MSAPPEDNAARDSPAPIVGGIDESAPPSPARRRRILLPIVAVTLVALAGWLAYEWWRWPDVAALASAPPKTTAFVERARAAGVAVSWTWMPDSRISPHLRHAVIVAEDMSFFSHDGFDEHEIRKAWEDFRAGERARGASTITQQLAKNLWLSPSRNPLRKLREALLARALEKHLTKRRILAIYTNVVEFGPGVFGAEAAARRYYGVAASWLTREEAAALAAGLPSSAWHPGADRPGYRRHLATVSERLRQTDWLVQLVQ